MEVIATAFRVLGPVLASVSPAARVCACTCSMSHAGARLHVSLSVLAGARAPGECLAIGDPSLGHLGLLCASSQQSQDCSSRFCSRSTGVGGWMPGSRCFQPLGSWDNTPRLVPTESSTVSKHLCGQNMFPVSTERWVQTKASVPFSGLSVKLGVTTDLSLLSSGCCWWPTSPDSASTGPRRPPAIGSREPGPFSCRGHTSRHGLPEAGLLS